MAASGNDVMDSEYSFPTISATTLVIANMVPLMGVLFGGWKVYDILVVFWLENVVIGVFNVLRIGFAEMSYPTLQLDGPALRRRKILMGVFFPVHYGMFVAFHGVIIFMTLRNLLGGGSLFDNKTWLLLTVAALVVSHGISFVYNYLGREEFRKADDETLMLGPYGRVVIMQVTLLVGGIPMTLTGSPVALLVLLILVKIGVDLRSHLGERKKYLKLALMKEQAAKPPPIRLYRR